MMTRIFNFFVCTIMCLLISGCASQRLVTPSDSYSISQFMEISHKYYKTVYTRSSGHIVASQIRFKGDSVYVDGEKSAAFQIHQAFAVSGIQKIRLRRGPSWELVGFLGGLTTGLISSVLIFNQDARKNDFPSYGLLSFIEIPPLTSILGLVIGHGFDQPKIYQGDYRIVPDGGTYRLRHIKQERRQPAQTGRALEE